MGRRRGRIRPDGGLIFSSATKARICGLFLLARKRRFHDFFKKRFWKNNLHLRVLNVVIPPRGNPLPPFGMARRCRIRNCVCLRLSGIYDKARIERGECLRKRYIALMETICIDGSRGAACVLHIYEQITRRSCKGFPFFGLYFPHSIIFDIEAYFHNISN